MDRNMDGWTDIVYAQNNGQMDDNNMIEVKMMDRMMDGNKDRRMEGQTENVEDEWKKLK